MTPEPLLLGLLLVAELPFFSPPVVVKLILLPSWILAFLAPAPPMFVPSSLTPPKLPNGDGLWAVDAAGERGLASVGVTAPGDAVCGIPPLMSSAATLSERVCLVGEGVSAIVTWTIGVVTDCISAMIWRNMNDSCDERAR